MYENEIYCNTRARCKNKISISLYQQHTKTKSHVTELCSIENNLLRNLLVYQIDNKTLKLHTHTHSITGT